MIKSLYIIDAGITIYSYNFVEHLSIDENLLGGFLSALGSFAQETFKTGLQTIQIQNGQKLVFYLDKEEKLTYCAIADERDNKNLLENLLSEISIQFNKDMHKILNSSNRSMVSKYESFDEFLKKFMENKYRQRNNKTIFAGLSIGMIIFLVLSLSLYQILIWLGDFIPDIETGILIYITVWPIILCFSSFISGYIAGSPKYGRNIGIILYLTILIYISFIEEIRNIFLLASSFIILACVAMGYLGGIMQDRKKLYPL